MQQNTITIHGPRLLDVTVQYNGVEYRGTMISNKCLSFEKHLPDDVMNFVVEWFECRTKQPVDYSLAAD